MNEIQMVDRMNRPVNQGTQPREAPRPGHAAQSVLRRGRQQERDDEWNIEPHVPELIDESLSASAVWPCCRDRRKTRPGVHGRDRRRSRPETAGRMPSPRKEPARGTKSGRCEFVPGQPVPGESSRSMTAASIAGRNSTACGRIDQGHRGRQCGQHRAATEPVRTACKIMIPTVTRNAVCQSRSPVISNN